MRLYLFLPFPVSSLSCCSCPASCFFLFPSLLSSSSPPVVSFPYPTFSFSSTAFPLAPPVSSLAPPVAFCPPIACLFILLLFYLILLLLCWLQLFPFVFAYSVLLSISSHLKSAVSSCPFPVVFSCLSFHPPSFWAMPAFITCAFFFVATFTAPALSLALVLSPFLFFLVSSLVPHFSYLSSMPSLSGLPLSSPSPRIFSPLLLSLLVLALPLLLLFCVSWSTALFVWSYVVISCSFSYFYDDPLLFSVTDDGSVSEVLCSRLLMTATFLSIPMFFFFFLS